MIEPTTFVSIKNGVEVLICVSAFETLAQCKVINWNVCIIHKKYSERERERASK